MGHPSSPYSEFRGNPPSAKGKMLIDVAAGPLAGGKQTMKEEPTVNAEAEKEGTKKDGKWHCRGRRCGKLGKLVVLLLLAGGIAGWVNFFL